MSLKKRLRPRLLAVYALAVAFVVFATPTLETLPLGVAMVLLGEGLRVWATGHLIKTDALTISGPYAYLRHPLYVGTLSIAAGFACMGHNPVILGLFGLLFPWLLNRGFPVWRWALAAVFAIWAIVAPATYPG